MNAQISPVSRQTARELDFRSNAGIEVTLLWNPRTDDLTVTVFDSKTNERLELTAAPDRALEVFNHPFAYAAASAEASWMPVSVGLAA